MKSILRSIWNVIYALFTAFEIIEAIVIMVVLPYLLYLFFNWFYTAEFIHIVFKVLFTLILAYGLYRLFKVIFTWYVDYSNNKSKNV